MNRSRIIGASVLGALASIIIALGVVSFDASAASETNLPAGAGAPDLVVQSIAIEKETVVSCHSGPGILGVRVRIANQGSAVAGPFVVEVDGAQQNVPGLAAMSEVSLWFEGYQSGSETEVEVDVNDTVDESNEDNNGMSVFLPIPTPLPTCTPEASLPDLVIQSIAIEKETVVSCHNGPKILGVRVRIANQGSAPAGSFIVELDGAQQNVPGLAAMSEVSLWFEGYQSGNETEVDVDVNDAVAESNEDNNGMSVFLPIPTPVPTCTPEPGLPGDASCDGSVDSVDAALILQRDAGLIEGSLLCQPQADVNSDGDIDALDATLILQHVAGLLANLPA
jgi:hypothetical protein